MDAKTQKAMRKVSYYITTHFTRRRQKLFAYVNLYTAEMDAKRSSMVCSQFCSEHFVLLPD